MSIFILFKIDNNSNLQAQELTVFDRGLFTQFYEDDQPIERKKFLSKINSIPESAEYWRKYKKNSAIGIVGSLASLGGIAWWLIKDEGENTTAPITMFVTTTIIGSIFTNKSFKNKRDAILSYNKDATVSSYVTPSNKGLGLTLHF